MSISTNDFKLGITRVLTDAFASSTVSENPKVIYIVSGQGGGKTSVIRHKKNELKEEGIRAYVIDSDKIAEYHPYYDELIFNELPDDVYKITRSEFVRPAGPIIYGELMRSKITVIRETVLNKWEADLKQIQNFRENGYGTEINVIATDLLESMLSCYERESAMLLAGLPLRGSTSREKHLELHNSFIEEIEKMQRMGLCDVINVYVRGENINKPPVLKYSTTSKTNKYRNFKEAIITERKLQREALLANPTTYLVRIENAKKIIKDNEVNPELTANELKGLDELQQEFIAELGKKVDMDSKEYE